MDTVSVRICLSGDGAVIDIGGPIGSARTALCESMRRLMDELALSVVWETPVVMFDGRRVRFDRLHIHGVDIDEIAAALVSGTSAAHTASLSGQE